MHADPSIQDSFFGAKIFYFSFTSIIFLILLLYKNPFLIAIQNYSLLLPLFLFLLILFSSYLFLTTGQNPGFAQKNPYHHIKDLEEGGGRIEESKEEEKEGGGKLGIENEEGGKGEKGERRRDIGEREGGKRRKEEKGIGEERKDGEEEKEGEEDICEKCGIAREIRMKHCNKCERCVHKFDHHCFWVGKF